MSYCSCCRLVQRRGRGRGGKEGGSTRPFVMSWKRSAFISASQEGERFLSWASRVEVQFSGVTHSGQLGAGVCYNCRITSSPLPLRLCMCVWLCVCVECLPVVIVAAQAAVRVCVARPWERRPLSRLLGWYSSTVAALAGALPVLCINFQNSGFMSLLLK